MSGDEPSYAESIVTNMDSIVFVGTLSEAEELFPSSKKTNLKGTTLLPGFIDAHAHFAGFPSQSIGAQILPPPDAGARCREAVRVQRRGPALLLPLRQASTTTLPSEPALMIWRFRRTL